MLPQNKYIYDALIELSELYETLNEVFRSKAYREAANSIFHLKTEYDPEVPVPHIGAGINAKIVELMVTDKIAQIDTIKHSAEYNDAVSLSRILGVGPSTIKNWHKLGITNVPKLRKAVAAQKVELTKIQKYGLIFMNDLSERIPRDEITQIVAKFAHLLGDHEIVGSYRRLAATSGDIDIIVRNQNSDYLQTLMVKLSTIPEFIDCLFIGTERATILVHGTKVRQIDILWLPADEYYSGLLYFTGSKDFNEAMRAFAKKQGYKLSQHGLFVNNKKIKASSEKDYFDILGLKYIPPENRINKGNIVKKNKLKKLSSK